VQKAIARWGAELMSELSDQNPCCTLDRAIVRYADALDLFARSLPHPSPQPLLAVLLARDCIEEHLPEKTRASAENIARLLELDARFQQLTHQAHLDGDRLSEYRASLKPPESAWWWFPEKIPAPRSQQPWWSRCPNFVWNLGTVVCLVFAGTWITSTAQTFSAAHGFDFVGTLATIGQGAGLAVVAGGALTERGKKSVEQMLASTPIPPHWHAEVTFVVALSLAGGTWFINHSVTPRVASFYYREGQEFYQKGEWAKAKKKYEQALSLNPDDPTEIQFSLGKIYEALGDLDRARSQYEKGLLESHPASLMGVGRVVLLKAIYDGEPVRIAAPAELKLVSGSGEGSASETKRDRTFLTQSANNATFFLRLAEEKNQKNEKDGIDRRLSDEQEIELHTNFGLVELVSIGYFNNNVSREIELKSNEEVREVIDGLDEARERFVKALRLAKVKTENGEFSRVDGGMSECYLSVTKALIEKIEASLEKTPPTSSQSPPSAIGGAMMGANAAAIDIEQLKSNAVRATCSQATPKTYFQYQQIWALLDSVEQQSLEIQNTEEIANLQKLLETNLKQKAGNNQPKMPLVYRVQVSEDGQIANYWAIEEQGDRQVGETPLPELKANEALETDRFALFKVVFAGDSIQVEPWQDPQE
jgi:tetratricopeptide (TPR) repeat protein